MENSGPSIPATPPMPPPSWAEVGGHDTIPALSSGPIQEPQAGTRESARPRDPIGPSSTGDSMRGELARLPRERKEDDRLA